MNIPGIAYNADGLVPCIVQDADTLEVLMMAWMSEESLALTLERGETVFWRSTPVPMMVPAASTAEKT